jgi:hypothetical protein
MSNSEQFRYSLIWDCIQFEFSECFIKNLQLLKVLDDKG